MRVVFAHRGEAAEPLEAESNVDSGDVFRAVVFADEDLAEDADRHVVGDFPVEIHADDQRRRSPRVVALAELIDERRPT